MNKNKNRGGISALVYDLTKPIADGLGLNVWDVVFEKEGAFWFLRVYIDKENGPVNMEDCENLTRPLSAALDEADPIEQSYTLEVGSPGFERTLKREEHFNKCIGKMVNIRYIREVGGVKEFSATLKSCGRGIITVLDGGESVDVNLRDTAYVKLRSKDLP